MATATTVALPGDGEGIQKQNIKRSDLMEKKTKRIFSRKVALELIQRGFMLERTEPNKNIKGLVTYLFVETPEFLEALTDITINK